VLALRRHSGSEFPLVLDAMVPEQSLPCLLRGGHNDRDFSRSTGRGVQFPED